jgi:hypothetical protein
VPDPTASTPIFDELRRELGGDATDTGRDAPGPNTEADRQDAANPNGDPNGDSRRRETTPG